MALAWLNIGSNHPDRAAIIDRAVALIRERLDPDLRISPPVVSEPWGFDSPNMFLNIGIEISAPMPPEELFNALMAIQDSISTAPHRGPGGAYIDRAIDIDLIAVEGVAIHTTRLILPHPRAQLRTFVMEPLKNLLLMPQV